MEAFFKEMKEMQDSIFQMKGDLGSFKSENQSMKTKITDIFEELERVKAENAAIRQDMEAVKHKYETEKKSVARVQQEEIDTEIFEPTSCENEIEAVNSVQCDNKMEELADGIQEQLLETVPFNDERESEKPVKHKDGLKDKSTHNKRPSTQYDDKLDAFDKKVTKVCLEVNKSVNAVNDFKKEFDKEMTKVREDSHKVAQLQRVFNIAHISFQAKKELEEKQAATPNHLSFPFPAAPSKGRRHPSNCSIPLSAATKISGIAQKATFFVTLEEIPLLPYIPVCIDEYTKVEKQCDFMDPETGIYTVPLQGKYEFYVEWSRLFLVKVEICICVDRDNKRIIISKDCSQSESLYFKTIYMDCQVNDKVWLEALSGKNRFSKHLPYLAFQGKKVS